MISRVVVAREAGAKVIDLDGSPYNMSAGATIAAGPAISGPLLDRFAPLLDDRSCP